MRLLLVEDDLMIGKSVRLGLKQDGSSVDWVRDAAAAELALSTTPYDLMLLDLGLPGRSGLQLLSSLRHSSNKLPVLIITARDSVADRIAGLDAGADDYLVKPFDLDELSARIRAVMRRHGGRANPEIEHGDLRLNPASHTVSMGNTALELSAREFALLQVLLEHPGEPLSRAKLEDLLYGWGEEVGSNAVEVHIHALRKKIGSDRIKNIRGVGYFLGSNIGSNIGSDTP